MDITASNKPYHLDVLSVMDEVMRQRARDATHVFNYDGINFDPDNTWALGEVAGVRWEIQVMFLEKMAEEMECIFSRHKPSVISSISTGHWKAVTDVADNPYTTATVIGKHIVPKFFSDRHFKEVVYPNECSREYRYEVVQLNSLTREFAKEVINEREKTNCPMSVAYENLRKRLIDQAQLIRDKGEHVTTKMHRW
jgi:hypothetical protein